MSPVLAPASLGGELPWPFDLTCYDRCPALTEAERATVNAVAATYDGAHMPQWIADSRQPLRRLLQPLEDVLARSGYGDDHARPMRVVVTEMARRGTAF